MKQPIDLVQTMHRFNKTNNHKNQFQEEIEKRKQTIEKIREKHSEKLQSSLVQLKGQQFTKPQKLGIISRQLVDQVLPKPTKAVPVDTKNENISDTDKLLFEKKFKNFLNHRQQFQTKAKQRREKIMQARKQKQQNAQNQQDFEDEYIDKEQLLKDTKGQNQFMNAEEMVAFYEEITFGKKNKKNQCHLQHAEKIEYLFRREEFDYLVMLEVDGNDQGHEKQLSTVVTSIKKDTLLNYLFDEPAIMMLYSINPYQLGDQLAEFETSNNGYLTFEDFSRFLSLDREPTYVEYSKQNLEEARKLGRGIKCQSIISKWVSDEETFEWLIELFRNVDILGEENVQKDVLAKKIRKQAERKSLLDQEIIQIVNINKLITLERILYQIQYSQSETGKISLKEFEKLLIHYHRLPTPQKDKLITKLILSGKYNPSYIFILGTESIQTIKQIFNSLPKFAGYFVPKEKFVEKLVKSPKFNKLRNQLVRSESNRYVEKQTVEETLARFLRQAQACVDIEQVLDFFTNRGRPRKIEHKIYITNLQMQLAKIQEEQRMREQKKLSQGDYSTSSEEEEFQKSIKQKKIQRKKDKLASIRAAQNFSEGKKFVVTVPNPFSFGNGVKQKTKISIRQKKLKEDLNEKRRLQDQSLQPIKPKPVPQHVNQDLFQKINRQQERQRKQRLERFRLQIQESMYPISPHLLTKPRSKSIYQEKSEYKFVAKPLPWYCEVNLLERIQKQKDERRERILEEIINKHNQYDLPEGVKKMIERSDKTEQEKQRQRALSKTTANDIQCTFNPKITQGIPDFQMIHEHLRIDLENKKQQKQAVEVIPFSFQNRPTRSKTAIQQVHGQMNRLKRSKQSQHQKEEQVNIPITMKYEALVNLRKHQEEEKQKKLDEEKRASTVRKMRQQKFAPYVRSVLRNSRQGDVAHSRAMIQERIKQFKRQERKRKRQYQEEMIKIYTKVFNRPLLVEGEGERKGTFEDDEHSRPHRSSQKDRSKQPLQRSNNRAQIGHYAQDYEMPLHPPEEQYSKRNQNQQDYESMRKKAIEHPPRNYLVEQPNGEQGHYEEEDYDGQYLSQNGRYTN